MYGFVQYSDKDNAQLVEVLKIQQVVIYNFSIFSEHRHIQRAAAGEQGSMLWDIVHTWFHNGVAWRLTWHLRKATP